MLVGRKRGGAINFTPTSITLAKSVLFRALFAFQKESDYMSETRYPLEVLRPAAYWLCELLTPACERIEVAGSIRRGKSTVKDIELVAISKTARLVFGEVGLMDEVDRLLKHLEERGNVSLIGPTGQTRYGPRYRQFWLYSDDGQRVPVDLFIVQPPAQWGSIFAIRTGPNDFNGYIMRNVLGYRGMRQIEGHLETAHGETINTPEEADWFTALGLPFIPPENRSVEVLRQLNGNRVRA
jgi:DNA polymerase (family 10)